MFARQPIIAVAGRQRSAASAATLARRRPSRPAPRRAGPRVRRYVSAPLQGDDPHPRGVTNGAAAIMVCAFAGMAGGQLVMFQQMGFGLAVAVLIDATVVRTIIVPAAMELLGDWNWYLPRWLSWLPNVSVEGHVAGPAAADDDDAAPGGGRPTPRRAGDRIQLGPETVSTPGR